MVDRVFKRGAIQKLDRFKVDPTIFTLLLLLAGLGFVTLYGVVGQNEPLLTRYVFRLIIGFALMFIFAAIPLPTYRRWGPTVYLLSIVLLILVLVIGEISKGAQRWLDIWLVRFQPSEILKIATPLLLCSVLASYSSQPNNARVMLSFLIIAVPVGLIALQPDLGTALLILASGLLVLFLVGISWYWIGFMLILAVGSAPLIWHLLHDYQRQRTLAFFNPESDPLGAGYHIIQSKIAIGSGGVWGKGWGNSTQVSLGFIPEHSTDFIFASYAEQFGFLGVCVLMTLYILLCVRGVGISLRAADCFSWLLASSFIFSFAIYFIINIAMVSGLLPVVGVTLPLLSYGGTATASLLASFGIISAVAKHQPMMKRI